MHGAIHRLWFSLRGRLALCAVIAILGMSVSALQVFYSSMQNAREKILEQYTAVGSQMQRALTEAFSEYELVARMVGYSTAVQT